MMAKIVIDAERKKARRDVAQQAVERVVDLVGRFNGNEVPKFLRAYNAEMTERGVEWWPYQGTKRSRSSEKLTSRGSPLKELYWRRTGTGTGRKRST